MLRLLLAAFLGLSPLVGATFSAQDDPVEAPRPGSPAAALGTSGAVLDAEELAVRIRPSVVVVSFTGRDGKEAGLGTGFVVSADGLIATNLHVIGEARPISVQTADGKSFDVVEVHATDRQLDLALIRIDAKNLPALALGNSSDLKQGQPVLALGNPRGLKHSVVTGVVSGRREIDGKPMIQLAIPIEPGNSGGPLLDREGRVHGLLTLKSLVTENLGFAVEIDALKPLIEKPNPVPISRWLTIGALDPGQWTTLLGARWKQRAGRIQVDGLGSGIGARALALSTIALPALPYEIQASVRLNEEDGAAGIVFFADGGDKHYGFYPSSGKLRLSRFDGPDVFHWNVLQEVRSAAYVPGEWNVLKVRLEKDRILCYVNDELVIESQDGQYTSGKAGLAKFRHTTAEFKGYRIASRIPPLRPDAETVGRISRLVAEIPVQRPPGQELVDELSSTGNQGTAVLRERARLLERQAERLKQLAHAVQQQAARAALDKELKQEEDQIDLVRAALWIARIDNDELDVDAYAESVARMAREIQAEFPANATEPQKLAALNRYLFEEMGFHGGRTNYYHRSNSYLNEVIDDREGLPITLSVLYMELARRVGLKVVGVGLPGHFITRFEPNDGEPQLIDPFDRGRVWTRAEAIAQVTSRVPFDEQFLAAQPKKAILVRMIRNLFGVARDAGDAEAMLRYTNTVLTINPDSAEDRWFRAVLHFQTARLDEAIADCNWLLDNRPAGIDLERVRQLLTILERPQ